MGQLATVIATEDSEFRTAVTQLVRSSGVPVSIVVERAAENGAGSPAIALVDVRSDGAALTDVERLRERWPGLAIIAVAGASEPDLILQAMRAGANEFFAWPRENGGPSAAMQEGIYAAVSRAAERLHAVAPGTGEVCRTLSFFGAKGGTGTTTLAVNCAVELARLSKRPTAIVDLNPFLGEVGLFLGMRPRFTVLDALDNLQKLDAAFLRKLVSTHKTGLDILAGSEQLDRPNVQDAAGVDQLLQLLGQCYAYVVVDGGSLTNPSSDMAVYAADSIFLVANPDVPSIRNTQRLIDRMTQMGIGDSRVQVLLNRMSDQHVIAPRQIEQAVGRPVPHQFPSDYRAVSAALNAGVPLTMSDHSEIADRFSRFTREIMGPDSETAEGEPRRGHFLNLF